MSALAIKTYKRRFSNCRFLPSDCWEEILKRVRQPDLPAMSLVSKDFLQVTNCFVNRIKVGNSDVLMASRIFNRFNSITELDLGWHVTDEILRLVRESLVSVTCISIWDKSLSSLNSLMELFRERRNFKKVILAGQYVREPMLSHIDQLFMLLPSVTHFSFDYENFLYDSTLLKLLQCSPQLEALYMTVFLRASHGEFLYHPVNESLRFLHLGGLVLMSSRRCVISSWCPNLEALAIERTYNATAVETVLMKFPRLKSLYIHFHGVEPEFTCTVDDVIAPLESFKLEGKSASYKYLKKMSKICPTLKNLEIQYYKGSVTRHTIKKLLDAFKDLSSLTLLCLFSEQAPFGVKFMKKLKPSLEFRIEHINRDNIW